MKQADDVLKVQIGRRFGRLPFVLLLTVGLLLSLLHCAGCGFDLATSDTTVVSTNADHGSAPDTPEQQLPCHSGHCLSHIAAHPVPIAAIPADRVVSLLMSGREQFPTALTGLPLFKPPRA
jgi:hypothetical protein